MKKYNKILLIVLSLSLFFSIKFTLAYLTRSTVVTNTFVTGSISSSVMETFNNNIKTDVYIKNDGNVNEYIRVFANIYYTDSNNTIVGITPKNNIDYLLSISSSSNWLYNSADKFYYYKEPIMPNGTTDILISEARELVKRDGLTLHIDIYSQAIQAEPIRAVTSSWGVNVTNNVISLGG